jgi:hypothetical protein
MADEILVQYKADVSGFHASMKSVQSDLKSTESVGATSAKSVQDSFKKTEVATESLRSKIRKLREELANATDPKDIERLAKETGKLTDQMQDAGDAARVFSSESKFEQVGTALGSIVGKLKNLDFKGAADQAKLLSAAAKGITFKETISSIKDLGVTFLNVAKSILANPFILTLTAIAGLAIAIKSYTDSLKENTAVIEENNAAIEKIRGNVSKLADDYDTAVQRRLKSEGVFTDIDEKRNAALKKYSDLQDKQYSDLKDAAKKYSEEIGVQDVINIDVKIRKEKELKKRLLELAREQAKELSVAGKVLNEEIAAINSEGYQSEKKRLDILNKEKLEKQKSLNEKLKKEADALVDLNLKRQQSEDSRLLKLSSDGVKERAKMLADQQAVNAKKEEDQIKEANDRKKQQEKDFNDEVAAIKKEGEAKITQDKLDAIAAREQLERDSISAIQSILGSIAQINSNLSQERINEVNEQADSEIAALQRQYDSDLISKEEYERQKSEINKRAAEEERVIKRRAFEANKQISLIQTIMSTAQATIAALGSIPYTPANIALAALTAAAGAAQIAVIASQPTPKFEEGGKVGGKRHSAGGTLIEAEKDEWVIRRNEAVKNNDLLSAINSGKADKFILEHYIAPALRAQQKKHSELKSQSFADNLSRSMILNSGNFKDGNLLESLKQSRKNDREIALFLAKELKQNYNPRNW